MKTLNTYYHDAEQFNAFVCEHNIVDASNLLVQLFCAPSDHAVIQGVIETIVQRLPSAHLIGSTTDGEILGANVSVNTIVVSLTQFEHTTLMTWGVERTTQTCEDVGETLARAIVTPSTKAIISFADGIATNGEAYLEGMQRCAQGIPIAGGLAGDLLQAGVTYVFTKEFISSTGAVGVSLNSATLYVHTDYNFNWTPIGKELTITKADHNRVYTIDDKTACEAYAYYLGDEIVEKIPNITIEFPLIVSRKGKFIARAALAKKEDGSILFAGNFTTGEKVRIGFGNVELILNDTLKSFENASSIPIESVFIYSCMARRRYMQEMCSLEIEPWAQNAPCCGFFTNGEFFTNAASEHFLMNQTMTILVLSEHPFTQEHHAYCNTVYLSKRLLDFASSMKALSRFINITTEELGSLNRHLNRAIDGSKDGLWSWNLETNEVYYSVRLKEMLGFRDDELKNTLRAAKERIHPDDRMRILRSIKACREGKKEEYNEIFRMQHKNGNWVWIHSRGTFFYNEAGKIIRASGFHTDVTESKTDTLEKEAQHRFLQSVINGIDASVIVVDKKETITLTNQNAQRFFIDTLFDVPSQPVYKEIYFQTPLHQIDPDVSYPMQSVLQGNGITSAVVKRVNTARELCDMEITITPLLDGNANVIGAIEVAHDISEYLCLQQELEVQKKHLKHLAQHDPLTGLPNRLTFSDRLFVALSNAMRFGEQVAILFIDLDHFKQMNDTLGHEFGDEILKCIAHRLKVHIRASDTVVRLGGDEFIVIIDKLHDKEEVVAIVRKILKEVAMPIVYKNHTRKISASIGISLFPEDGEEENALLKNADMAMYQAKEKGGNCYVFF